MHQLDISLFQLVNAWCGNWVLDRLAQFEEHHNFYKGGLFMLVYCWFWCAPTAERRDANRRIIVATIAGTFIALVANRAMATVLPFRLRPMFDAASGYRPPLFPIAGNMEDWNAFPSDTGTLFFALSFGLFRLSRPMGIVMTAYSIVWISLPRLYVGLHFPSDIIAGALLGMAVVYLAAVAMDARGGWLGRRVMNLLGTAEQEYPQYFYVAVLAVVFEIMTLFDDVRDLGHSTIRFLRLTGHLAVGEGAALFIAGGAVLLVACAVGAVVWRQRSVKRRVVHRDRPFETALPRPPPKSVRTGA